MSIATIDAGNLSAILDLFDPERDDEEAAIEQAAAWLADGGDLEEFDFNELDPVQRDDVFYGLGMLQATADCYDVSRVEVFRASLGV